MQVVPVNIKSLEVLLDITGSIHSSLIFSKIAFAFANTKIFHENKKWCCIKKQDLANWAGLSIRTIDSILYNLSSKGLILKKSFVWNDKLQSHFHIPNFAIKAILERLEALNRIDEDKKECSLAPSESQSSKNPQVSPDLQKSRYSKDAIKASTEEDSNELNKSQNCRYYPAKKGVSIKIRTNLKKTNNNTRKSKLSTDKTRACHQLSHV